MTRLCKKFNREIIFKIKRKSRGGGLIAFELKCLKEDFLEEVIWKLVSPMILDTARGEGNSG